MRLLLKHVFGSVRKRPLQPLVILLTLILSVTVMTVAVGMGDAISDEIKENARAENGSADLTVSLTGNSESRFMFTDDVRAAIGDGAAVSGYYEIPMTVGGTSVFGAAADIGSLENIFSLSFSEYGRVTTWSMESTVFITREIAEELGVAVSDTVTINLFGKDKVYTVQGVSELPFMGRFSVLLDIGGAMRLLAEDSFMASVLGDDFRPSTRILIDLPDGADVDEYSARLKSSALFADKSITDVRSSVAMIEGNNYLEMVVDFAILFSLILSVAVIFSCLYILSSERSEDNATLYAAGAKRWLLRALSCAEIFAYWLISVPLGALLSLPLTSVMSYACGLIYTEVTIGARALFLSAFFALIASALAIVGFLGIEAFGTSTRAKKKGYALLLPSTVVCGAFVIMTFLLHGKLPMVFGSISMVMLFISAALACPEIITKCIQLFTKSQEKRMLHGKATRCIELYYALKNLLNVRALHNVARLSALTIAIVLSVFSITSGAVGCIKTLEGIVSADVAVLNVTANGEELLSGYDGVERCGGAFVGSATHENGFTCIAISVDDTALLSADLASIDAPIGDSAVISYGYSRMFSLNVGDRFRVDIDGASVELRASQTVRTDMPVIIFNASDVGVSENVLLAYGGDKIALTSDISEALSEQMATVIPCCDLYGAKADIMRVYSTFGQFLLLIVLMFAFIGFLDNLVESYRARSDEFSLYRLAGLTRRGAARMKMLEVFAVVIFGAVIGALLFLCSYVVMNEAFLSLAYDFSASLGNAFGK